MTKFKIINKTKKIEKNKEFLLTQKETMEFQEKFNLEIDEYIGELKNFNQTFSKT